MNRSYWYALSLGFMLGTTLCGTIRQYQEHRPYWPLGAIVFSLSVVAAVVSARHKFNK